MTLFKYLPSSRWDVLENRKIRFTQPGEFNDLFELLYGLMSKPKDWRADRILHHTSHAESFGLQPKSTLGELSNLTLPEDSYFDRQNVVADKLSNRWGKALVLSRELVHIADQYLGILSLSGRCDNLLMWSHYAEDHRGFVIGFDEKHPFFTKNEDQKDLPKGVRKVRYRKTRRILDYDRVEDVRILFEKSADWAYEEEYRMLMPLKAGVRIKKTVLQPSFPFDEPRLPVHMFKIPAQCIESIILGARFPEWEEEKIEQMCRPRCALRHVKTYKANPNPKDYKVDIF